MWVGDREKGDFQTECHFVHQVHFTFNIPIQKMRCHVLMQVTDIGKDFLKWIKEFAEKNNIQFPYIETFFKVLLYNSLAKEIEDSTYTDPKDFAEKTHKSLYKMLEENEGFEENSWLSGAHFPSTESMDLSEEMPSGPKMKGEIWFEPMEDMAQEDVKQRIVIQELHAN